MFWNDFSQFLSSHVKNSPVAANHTAIITLSVQLHSMYHRTRAVLWLCGESNVVVMFELYVTTQQLELPTKCST